MANENNENVEFNEVHCKKLVLGDEKTGFITLKVNGVEGVFTSLSVESSQDKNSGEVQIEFHNGIPRLRLANRAEDMNKGDIVLAFGKEGNPYLLIEIEDGGKSEKSIMLGISVSGQPRLFLLNEEGEEDTSVSMGTYTDGSPFVMLVNENLDGGNIVLWTNDDGANISISSAERIKKSLENPKDAIGLLLASNKNASRLLIEGVMKIVESRKNQDVSSAEKDTVEKNDG